MTVTCSWCGRTLPSKEPLADPGDTHTICPVCLARELALLRNPPPAEPSPQPPPAPA